MRGEGGRQRQHHLPRPPFFFSHGVCGEGRPRRAASPRAAPSRAAGGWSGQLPAAALRRGGGGGKPGGGGGGGGGSSRAGARPHSAGAGSGGRCMVRLVPTDVPRFPLAASLGLGMQEVVVRGRAVP